MTRRVSRRAQLVGYLGPLQRAVQAQLGQANQAQQQRNRRPVSVPQQTYRQRVTVPIAGGYASAAVAAGTATCYVGPAGVGTIWFPTMAVIGTTTGVNDASTCALYLSPLMASASLASLPQLGGQSYAGGGDTIGLSVPPVYPGTFLIAIWSNANNGDLATLTVYGDQEVLT